MKSIKKLWLNIQPAVLIVLSCYLATSCSSKSDDKKSPATTQTEYLSSYEVVDGCSSGHHILKANSEAEIESAFCNALMDEDLNKHCAAGIRADLFRNVSCKGVFPVKVSSSVGVSSTFSKSYAYQEDSCGTGVHFFYASSMSKATELLCKALQDDALNRNCAKSKREEAVRKNECVKATVAKPEENQTATPPKKDEPNKDDASSSPFSCYHEKNICDEKTQYCLISKDSNGLRNTDECLNLPSDCKDDDCLIEAAQLRFCKDGNPNHCTDNCKAGAQLTRKNDRVTILCSSPPLKKHY